MADLFYIDKVTITKDTLRAEVVVAEGMPLMTSENIEATARVYYLAPGIADHMCLGDAGEKFRDCMGNTEIAHLLEHLTVEIMNQTGLAGKIAYGRTQATDEEGVYEIELSCPDDVLTVGALSSAVFMMTWAFTAPKATAPDFDGTVEALKTLALSMRPVEEPKAAEPADEGAAEPEGEAEELPTIPVEGVEDDIDDPQPEPVAEDESQASLFDEPSEVIDTEGVVAVPNEVYAGAEFGGAAAPDALPFDGVDADTDDPGATVPMAPIA